MQDKIASFQKLEQHGLGLYGTSTGTAITLDIYLSGQNLMFVPSNGDTLVLYSMCPKKHKNDLQASKTEKSHSIKNDSETLTFYKSRKSFESEKSLSMQQISKDVHLPDTELYAPIKTRDFSFYYGKKAGIENITIDIYPNTVTAIIGPSGCGKSTFLRSINRINDLILDTYALGLIEVDGQNVYGKGIDLSSLREKVGMVFQRPNPFPKSIFDNVAYGPRLNGTKKKGELTDLVESSLQKAGLWDEVKDILKRSALALSGGQQQRLCIARAIANDPKILLMDEPCSALDPIATARIEDLMVELEKDYTIIIVTHVMEQARRISKSTAFFHLGYLIEYGTTEQVFENPKEKLTLDYITGRF
jgi:phosphate transport system ATP-binding protein